MVNYLPTGTARTGAVCMGAIDRSGRRCTPPAAARQDASDRAASA
jgi:hypothetical protein